MSDDIKMVGGVVVLTLVILLGIVLAGHKNPPTNVSADAKIVRDDSYSVGPSNAPVTLVEFGDYQCPACGAAYPTLKRIRTEYDGKLKFVFREFPLSQHRNARAAALAAESAGNQSKYFDMSDKLYENQSAWENLASPNALFAQYAKDLGLNTDQFTADMASAAIATRVDQDTADGNGLGVNATPTIFLNGTMLTNGVDYNDLKTRIDKILKDQPSATTTK